MRGQEAEVKKVRTIPKSEEINLQVLRGSLDDAARRIRALPVEQRPGWVVYLMEALESDATRITDPYLPAKLGLDWVLQAVARAIGDRLAAGIW